jgi:hypothetical protein
MDSFEVGHSVRYLRHKGTLSKCASRSSPGSSLFFLFSLFLPFDHSLHPVRQLVVCMSFYYFLKYPFPTLLLLGIDALYQLHFTIPRHLSRLEFIFGT